MHYTVNLNTPITDILNQLIGHRITVDQATDRLLQEMGRGGRILVVDEDLLGLDGELSELGYTVDTVDTSLPRRSGPAQSQRPAQSQPWRVVLY